MGSRGLAVLPLACAISFALAPVSAQAKAPTRIEVKCVDADGKPVADAEVHVFQSRKSAAGVSDYIASGPHRTDQNGVATTQVALDSDGGRFDRWLYARVPGKLVGAARWLHFDGPTPATPDVRLGPSRELHGRVQVPEGVDARTVRVRTLTLWDPKDPLRQFPRAYGIDGLQTTLPALFDAEVGADGAFVLRDLPPDALLYLAAEGPGLAQAQWFNAILPEHRIPELVAIPMARESVIEGTATGPDGRALADAPVSAQLQQRGSGVMGVMFTFRARTDGEGRFRIAGLPDGEFAAQVTHDAGVMRPQIVKASEGARVEATVQLETGIEVRGSVRNPQNIGIEGASVSAVTPTSRSLRLGWARTDGQGNFVMRLPTGEARLYLMVVPHGYARPEPQVLVPIDVKADDPSLRDVRFELQPAK